MIIGYQYSRNFNENRCAKISFERENTITYRFPHRHIGLLLRSNKEYKNLHLFCISISGLHFSTVPNTGFICCHSSLDQLFVYKIKLNLFFLLFFWLELNLVTLLHKKEKFPLWSTFLIPGTRQWDDRYPSYFLHTKTFLILSGSPYNSHFGFTPPRRNAWRSPINNVCLGSQEATRGVLNGNLGRGVPPKPSKPDSVWDKDRSFHHLGYFVTLINVVPPVQN